MEHRRRTAQPNRNPLRRRRFEAQVVFGALTSLALACGNESPAARQPEVGETEFVSADGVAGQQGGRGADAGAAAPGSESDDAAGDRDERTVQEGDIYRVLASGHLLNLNSYRGLQIVDVRNPAAPRVVGRLNEAVGSPVELYALGETHAVVLLNNWRGYYGERADVPVQRVEGGVVVVVDLSDRANPRVVSRAHVPGYITTSRLATDGTSSALYVAAQVWQQYDSTGSVTSSAARTVVKSFDVSGNSLLARGEVDLGGYVTAIQGTPEALLVARFDGSTMQSSRVGLIDISDVHGHIVEGADVPVSGYVATQFNMDLRGGVLRVASGSRWSGAATNYLETFDARNLAAVTPLDTETFGDGQDLFATIFLEDRAFCVTYLRQDPFHAFSIDASGQVEERAEFVVSGWNDFFRPVSGGRRLIGIGVNDESNRTVAVSLYDAEHLENPTPLLARAEVETSWGWSEANWDHRAFSVIEGAVDVVAPDGTPETGLVLLPFSGSRPDGSGYTAAVQIYTFSDHTLTRRGVMEHGTPVRRSFEVADDLTGNLSESELALHDTSSPDAPVETGRVKLAPNYRQLLRFGAHLVRVEDTGSYWGSVAREPVGYVQTLAPGADADRDAPIAEVEIPSYAQLFAVGNKLAAVTPVYDGTTGTQSTDVAVFDYTNPAAPTLGGETRVDRALGGYYGGYYGPGIADDCFDCGRGYYGGYYGGSGAVVAGSAVVFPRLESQSEVLGTQRTRSRYPTTYCEGGDGRGDECATYVSGGIYCTSQRPNGASDFGAEICNGSFTRCTRSDEGMYDCAAVDASEITTQENTWEGEWRRYWTTLHLDVLDVSGPAPTVAPSIDLPLDHEYAGLVGGGGTDVFYAYKVPTTLPGDARPYVRYFAQRIDLTNPSAPALGTPVNVPGTLVAVHGSELFTQDLQWFDTADGNSVAETVVQRLALEGNVARLVASRRFAERRVDKIVVDGTGDVFVSHAPTYGYYYGYYDPSSAEQQTKLAILARADLAIRSETSVDSWATFNDVRASRALFQVPGGLLLFDARDASNVVPQAYFAVDGYWAADILFESDAIRFAAGPYGIYAFDPNANNLLTD